MKKAKLEGRRPRATANIMTAKTIAIPISDDVPMSSWKLSRASELITRHALAEITRKLAIYVAKFA